MTAKQSIFGNIQYQNASNVPKLLWTSLFDGTIAITTPDNDPTIYYYTGNITGVDSRGHGAATLNSAFGITGSASSFRAEYIMDDILVDHPLSDIFVTTFRPSTFIDGIGNEVEIRQVARNDTEWSGSRPQCELTIELSNSTEAINEYYCTKMFEVPANIIDILDRPAGAWTVAGFVIEDVKCGPTATNDARILINLIKVQGETGLRLRAQLDNSGTDTLTGVTNGVIAGLDADGVIDYGQTDEGAILPGKQYRLGYWIKRSAGRADLSTGRFVADVTRLDTKEKFNIIDKTGGQFWGYHSHHFKRFFPVICYTGGFPSTGDITIKYSNIQYWSKPPRNISFTEPVAIDASLAGGTTQPREGTDTLSIDFTSSTPTQVTIARNDNASFAVWPDGNLSQYFTQRTGGLDFAVSLAHMNLGVNTIGVKASYADYRKATDSIALTIEEVVEADPEEISVAMAGGLTQYQEGIDTLQITFVNGTPIAVNIARNDNITFAQWPTGNLYQYFREVSGGLEFDLSLAHLNLGENSIGVTATYSDASTAEAFLTLHISEVPAEEPPPDPTPPSPLPAFPGAEGFGAASVGGRGGAILFVTNLNDSGAGSLREALLTTGPRTVIFRVGGTIDLLSDISLSGASLSYLTVAGQTAPGGIQTRYKTIEMSNGIHDVIIRFLRHRRGWEDYTPGIAESNNYGPGLTIYSYGSPCYNIILDHCSFAWQQDDNSFWQSVHDVTWQWCIMAEAKNTIVDGDPVPLKGVNGKGLIAGTEDGDGALMYNVSMHHNFMAHNYQRSPLVKGAGLFEIVNNLIYNWAAFGTSIDYTNAEGSKVNLIGNYYKEGPDAFDRYAVTINDATHPADMIYVSDNISPQRTSGAQDEWEVMGLCDGSPYCNTPASTSYQKATPWAASDYPITIDAAVDVPALVLAGVGATLPARDATDTRIVSEYYLGTGSIHTYNSWPTITGTTAPTDADNDGMVDTWETSEGVTNPNTVAANGYTNLENYINSLVP